MDQAEIAAFAAMVDDPAHKIVVTEQEAQAVFDLAAHLGYGVKLAHKLPVLLVDDVHDLWVVDAVKSVRRGS